MTHQRHHIQESPYLALEIQKEECGCHGDDLYIKDDCLARRDGGEEGQLERRIRGLAQRPGRDKDERGRWHTRAKSRYSGGSKKGHDGANGGAGSRQCSFNLGCYESDNWLLTVCDAIGLLQRRGSTTAGKTVAVSSRSRALDLYFCLFLSCPTMAEKKNQYPRCSGFFPFFFFLFLQRAH